MATARSKVADELKCPIENVITSGANPTAPSDKTAALLKFETHYAMHPVNLYPGGITSAGFPGAACRYIEQVYEDKVVAAFPQGAEGEQNPLYLRVSTAAMLRRVGQKYTGQPLVREEVGAEIGGGRRPMVPLDAKAAAAKAAEVQMGIGDVALTPVNAQICGAIAQSLKAKSPVANTVLAGLANGQAGSGYVPTDEAFGHYTFQVPGSRLKPGCAETGIQKAALEMLNHYVIAEGKN